MMLTAVPSAPAAAVPTRVRDFLASLDDAPLEHALNVYAALDGAVEAARSRRLAAAMAAAADAGQDPVKLARSAASRGGKCSRRQAELSAKRAGAVGANPTLADQLDSGVLSPGQIDNIAHAMATDTSAATDQNLIAQIAERSVDQGRRVANDWVVENTSAGELEVRHQRQRRNRSVQKYWSVDRDAKALTLYGDGPTIDQLWRRINAQERIEYQNDGGRSVAIVHHPRTRDQRRFDAALAIFNGTGRPAAGRPAAVVSIPWASLNGKGCAEQIGYGPIPDSAVLQALLASDLFVNITGLRGESLWLGRTRRNADRNQFISLVLRDKGCVLCGSDWQASESHHLMPWEAPGRGETNIDNLALVCSGCHHRLHDNHLTLARDPTTWQWITRPAKPEEIAPKRRTKTGTHADRGRSIKQPSPNPTTPIADQNSPVPTTPHMKTRRDPSPDGDPPLGRRAA